MSRIRSRIIPVMATMALAPVLLAAGSAPSGSAPSGPAPSSQDEPAGMTPWSVEPGAQGSSEQGGGTQNQNGTAQTGASPVPAAQPGSPPPAAPQPPANAQPAAPADDQLAQQLMGRWGQNPSCTDFFVEFRPDGLALMFEMRGRRKSADWGSFSITDGVLTINHITGAITHTRIHFEGDALVGEQGRRRPSRLVRCADQPH